MSVQESKQRFWLSKSHESEQIHLKKAVNILLILIFGVAGFHLLPGNWAALPFAVTPILLFLALFGRYFRDIIWSDPDSHAPLVTFGGIYVGMCWFIITNAH